MVMSMTGYGNDTFHIDETSVTVEIRSVNSRYLDFIPKIPPTLRHLEMDIKQIIQTYFHRGRIEIYISVAGDFLIDKRLHVDWELMDQYFDHLRQAKHKYDIKNDIPLSAITAIEGLFTVQELKIESDQLKSLLLQSIERACKQVLASRQSEGAFLLEDIQNRIKTMENMLKSVEERKEEVYVHYRNRIKTRIEQHIARAIDVDQIYLLQEIALLAEKGDIAEEITRLHSHFHHFRNIISQDSPIGRKLDFIAQEMHREANTIGAKSVDAKISEWIVIMKSEIDKIKEQVQNIE